MKPSDWHPGVGSHHMGSISQLRYHVTFKCEFRAMLYMMFNHFSTFLKWSTVISAPENISKID